MHVSKIEAAAAATLAFTIAADDVPAFRAAVDVLARHVVEKRNTFPILSHVALCADPAGLEMRGTDLDIFAAVRLPAAVQMPGAIAVDVNLLRDIVRKAAKGAAMAFAVSETGRLMVSDGRADRALACLPADDLPNLKAREFPNPLSWEIEAAPLSADLARLAPAVSTEETRYYLNGIYIHSEGGKRIMAATNGHILALIRRGEGVPDHEGGIMPRKLIPLVQAIAKGGEPFAFTLDSVQCAFTSGAWSIRAKMIDGSFPDYRRVIPELSGNVLQISAAELREHADKANKAHKAAGTKRENKSLIMELGAQCRAGVAAGAAYARPLSGEYKGEPLTAGYNPDYLKAFATGELVQMDIPGAESPCTFTDPAAPDYLGVMMPMRLDGSSLPVPAAVHYPDIKAAPGQAADLFAIEPYHGSMATGKDKPRKATEKECTAYLIDYAKRCGLPVLDGIRLIGGGDIPHGLVIGEIAAPSGYPASDGEYAEGAYCVPMPGRKQAPVTLETQADDGSWSAPVPCADAAGNIMLPDAPKARKARKVKAAPAKAAEQTAEIIPGVNGCYQINRGEFGSSIFFNPADVDGCAQPGVMIGEPAKRSEAEIAAIIDAHREPPVSAETGPAIASSIEAIEAEGAPIEPPAPGDAERAIQALNERLDAAEIAIAERPRIRIKAIAVPETPPSGENGTIIPWPGARARLKAREAMAAERAARERARRERIVRAYLKMRRERDKARAEARENEAERLRLAGLAREARDKRRRAVMLAKRHWEMRLVARGQYQAAERLADQERAARRAIAATGRTLAMKARQERDKLATYKANAGAQYERACGERDMAKRLLAAARDQLAALERERDSQAHAIAALASRIERVEAAAGERLAA